jgi:hypothetical protein
MQRRQQCLRWQRGVHVDIHWYRHGHDLSRITLSDSHVPDGGGHGEWNQAIVMKTPDFVDVWVNRIGKVRTTVFSKTDRRPVPLGIDNGRSMKHD